MTVKHNTEIKNNRDKIQSMVRTLKAEVLNGSLEDAICDVKHRFANGCYLREIFMPAGARVIGKIHATEHFNIILKGKVTVVTAEGKETFSAPYTFVSKAGTQKVVLIHEDCIWQTVHVTESTDLEEIEKEVIADSYDDLIIDELLTSGAGVLK